MITLMERNGHATQVVTNGGRMVMLQRWSLMEGEWLCYGGGQFNGGRNGHVTEVVTLMEGKWSRYRGGQFTGGRRFMLGGQFNGGRMVMLQRWPV